MKLISAPAVSCVRSLFFNATPPTAARLERQLRGRAFCSILLFGGIKPPHRVGQVGRQRAHWSVRLLFVVLRPVKSASYQKQLLCWGHNEGCCD